MANALVHIMLVYATENFRASTKRKRRSREPHRKKNELKSIESNNDISPLNCIKQKRIFGLLTL